MLEMFDKCIIYYKMFDVKHHMYVADLVAEASRANE